MQGLDNIDPYEELGISPKAEDVVVRAAWKALIRKYHPDTSTAPDAAERSAKINAAFKLVISPEARAAYDRSRTASKPTPVRPPPRPGTASPHPHSRPHPALAPQHRPWRKFARIGLAVALVGAPIFYLVRPDDSAALFDPAERWADGIVTDPGIARLRSNARRMLGLDASPAPDSGSAELESHAGPPPAIDKVAITATVSQLGQDPSRAVDEGRSCATAAENGVGWAALDNCTAVHIAGLAIAKGMFDVPDANAAYFEQSAAVLPERYTAVSGDSAAIALRIEAIRSIVWSVMLTKLEGQVRERGGPER